MDDLIAILDASMYNCPQVKYLQKTT